MLVEIVVEGLAGARIAAAAGADRLELVSALGEGGLSPGPGTLTQVVAGSALPVMVMARPRGGDFCYDDDEFAALCQDAVAAVRAGAAGVVAGVLRPDGTVDRDRTRLLVQAVAPTPLTFHRAFDLTPDPERALADLVAAGVARVLTSGQAASAPAGAACIARLVQRAEDRIVVMAGGGVRADNVRALVDATGVREVHLSASARAPGPMQFRRAEVAMGTDDDQSRRRVTDGTAIAAVLAALAGGA